MCSGKLTAVDFVIIVWARTETKLIYFVASKYTKIVKNFSHLV